MMAVRSSSSKAARLDETVGLEPGTRHDPERLDGAAGGLDASALSAVVDRAYPGIRVDVAAQSPQILRERRRNEPVVDQRRRRDVQPGHAYAVRLDLADLLGCESTQTGDSVRLSAPLQLVERRHLARIRGHDQLPALVVRDLLLLAVLPQEQPAGGAELRLERAGRVVDARVHDTAVAAGLVQRDRRFLLDDDDAPLGQSPPELDGSGQPEDPRSDDNDVHAGGQRGLAPGKVALGFSSQGR